MNAPVTRRLLEAEFPELMKGIKPGKKGISVRVRPSTDPLPPGSIIFE
jgi:hypothetical protein